MQSSFLVWIRWDRIFTSQYLGSATSKRVFPNRTAHGVPSGD